MSLTRQTVLNLAFSLNFSKYRLLSVYLPHLQLLSSYYANESDTQVKASCNQVLAT